MIELQPNTLYTDIDNNRKIRLLYCMARNRSEGERVVYVIRADGGATMPYEEAYETFVDLIEEGIYQKIEEPAIRLPISPMNHSAILKKIEHDLLPRKRRKWDANVQKSADCCIGIGKAA